MAVEARADEAPPAPRATGWAARMVEAWQRLDGTVYAIFAMSCAIYAASSLHGQILAQTGGVWIVPRDDVYHHFEHARALVQGRPFTWTAGAGYGSGDPSLAYVALLALGKLAGFRQLRLAAWAALLGCLAVGGALVALGRALGAAGEPPGRWSRFLLPPFVLSVGGVAGGLLLGELGLLMAAWSLALLAAGRLRRTGEGAAWLGAAVAVAVATRWESFAPLAIMAIWAARWSPGRAPARSSGRLARALGPAVALLCFVALLNAGLTADVAPSEVVVGSPMLAPHSVSGPIPRAAVAFGETIAALHQALGAALPWWLVAAAFAFISAPRRGLASVIAAQAVGWVAVVALTTPAERRAVELMPAALWLAVLATQGLGVLGSRAEESPRLARSWAARAAVVVGALAVHAATQLPRVSAEIWRHAHEARRLLDEDVTLGLAVAETPIDRILVPSPGALTYVAGRPALDRDGRGGFRGLPFARARRLGDGATLELLERIPVAERPDAAIGRGLELLLPPTTEPLTWLATRRGPQPLWRTRWDGFDRRGAPRTLADGERVIAQLDVADLASEDALAMGLTPSHAGWVSHAILADPRAPDRDLFDAGRHLEAGHRLSATLDVSGHRVLVRLAPSRAAELTLALDDDAPFATLRAEPRPGVWQELAAPLPDGRRERRLHLEAKDDLVVYHLWVVGR